jgi:Domain of unknown function (DUF4062)
MVEMTKVFVSSTYTDLLNYRDVVQRVIRQAEAVAVGMEDFGARDERPLAECLKLVEQSDVFVGVYAHRYGFIPDGLEISIAEAEYQHAISKSIPVFAYVVDDNHPWPPGYVDKGENAVRLARFKELLRKNHIVKAFKEEFELAAFVAADLRRHTLRTGLSDARLVSTTPATPARDSALPGRTKNMRMPEVSSPSNSEAWNKERYSIYDKNKNLFLHYDLEASNVSGQKFDVTIYLVRKSNSNIGLRRDDLHDVERAEFFFGPSWNNNIYTVQNTDGRVGIVTSAYGEFLAHCKVYVRGESLPINLHQFIRFPNEMEGEAAT